MCQIARESGACAAVPCHHWERGGRGSLQLAQAVKEAASSPSHFQFLYDLQVRDHTQSTPRQSHAAHGRDGTL